MIARDPVDEFLKQDTQRDHEAAKRRGERLNRLGLRIADELISTGVLPIAAYEDVRIAVHTAVADEFYGNQSVDLPTVRR